MALKYTIIIDGEEFILDYGSGTIHREVILIPEGTPGYFPMKGEERYPFKNLKNELYFQRASKFYKVVNEKEVLEITKEEYDETRKYITINKNFKDIPLVKNYKNYVMSIIINEIMQEKYNKKILIPISMKVIIIKFITRLSPKTNLDVDNLTKQIISELPTWIKRDEVEKLIKEAYEKILQENEGGMRLLLDNIYESNKDNFDALYNDLLDRRHHRKKENISREEPKKIKREKREVKLTLPAGKATPAPPVGTVLGPNGINIPKFCKEFNEWSKDKEGNVEFGVIIYDDLSYDILTREEMKHRGNKELSTLLSLRPEAFKTLYDPTEVSSEDDNLEKEINPISIIRQKLETLYNEFGGNPSGGEIIAIEKLDCAIGKGKDLHFDQNELNYYAEEGFIHIKGTEEEFPSESHIQLKGKDKVVLSKIKEDSEEFKYLSNLIKKIDSILQPIIIRKKLETLYNEFGGNPSGGEIIVIEELDCTIGKGRNLHFDQNELNYYAEEGFIHIKGTEEEFPSKSYIQLKGKDMVVLSEIKEDSEEFKYLSNLIKKIDSILQSQNKTHPSK